MIVGHREMSCRSPYQLREKNVIFMTNVTLWNILSGHWHTKFEINTNIRIVDANFIETEDTKQF